MGGQVVIVGRFERLELMLEKVMTEDERWVTDHADFDEGVIAVVQ